MLLDELLYWDYIPFLIQLKQAIYTNTKKFVRNNCFVVWLIRFAPCEDIDWNLNIDN